MKIDKLPKGYITDDQEDVFCETILKNPYLQTQGIKPYLKQIMALYVANHPETKDEDGLKKPNTLLCGAGGFGGKTYLGSMLASQHLLNSEEGYTCLVTRRNYAELVDTNSIWDNLVEWCCNEDLPIDYQCDFKQSPTPQITAPNGNTIYFKAFDREAKKQKFKSASYDRIINDEASELPNGILQFQYRSSRNTSLIPRSIINLSNPSGDSTDYLVEHFVDGKEPYIAMDWRDNPFIDKKAYEGSLSQLSYIDQQYQKYGNWHYRPSQGDLIDLEDLQSAYINVEDYIDREVLFCTMGMDLASTGKDNTAVYNLICLENGIIVVNDIMVTPSSHPEQKVHDIVERQARENGLYVLAIEQEPGADSTFNHRYWRDDILADIIFEYGVVVKKVPAIKSKFNRAMPVATSIKNGRIRFSYDLKDDFEKPNGLFEQFMYVSPDSEIMKKHKSPDDLDALGYAWQEMLQYVQSIQF